MIIETTKLKLLMIGPTGSGKTQIANYLSDVTKSDDEMNLQPTKGVRILEFELSDLNAGGKNVKLDIELWDCSGDHKYETCWPAMRADVKGVILVCCPSTNNASRELELLYNYFVSQPKLSAKQCVVFNNIGNQQEDMKNLNLSSTFAKVSQVSVNLPSSGNRLKIDFSNFVSSVLQSVNNK